MCKEVNGNTDFVIENTYECVSNCKDRGYYAYASSGDSDSYYKVNSCVFKCPLNKPYADDNGNCVEQCTNQIKFFIREFKHYENNIQKECKPKCPDDYPYYTIYNDENGKKAYGCQETCDNGYLVIGEDILCIPDCPDETSVYKDEYNQYI